ncbi:hypothetical protein [Streptomyces sp. NPDC059874]|uniref:hypothetical protein n=1 Tax=Streptomyces sp. NPDC059874 TaxID=3346983 RepID=UPI0036538E44
MTTEGDGPPGRRLTGFLCAQARRAGLGSREIGARLAVAKEASGRVAADGNSPDPLATVPCSKSHVDRVLKGQAPVPSWPFVREFLKVTSRAAGLSVEEYRELCETAKGLLRGAATQIVAVAPADAGTSGDTVAALRLEVELERARHTETRLRYALRDAQFLTTTLWFIISALRDIIADRDALLARADGDRLARLRDETRQALAHKRTAETEADRAVARIRTLEGFWEQARRDVQRLAQHPDAADLTTAPAYGAGPAPALVPQELLAQPALDDIAGALAKAQALNVSADEAAREMEQTLASGKPVGAGDEFAVLLAATELDNADLRAAAAESLAARWADRPQTRDALLRLVDDPEIRTRRVAADGLGVVCPGDADARVALLRLARVRDDLGTHLAAVRALSHGWPGDPEARDIYLELAKDQWFVRDAVQAMVTGYAGDEVVRDHLLSLADGGSHVRADVAEALGEGWRGDAATRGCLVRLAGDRMPDVRVAALTALGAGWPGDRAVRAVLMVHVRDVVNVTEAAEAAEQLAAGWPGDAEIGGVLDDLAHDLGPVRAEFFGLAARYRESMTQPGPE